MKLVESSNLPLHQLGQWFCPGNVRNDVPRGGILVELVGRCHQTTLCRICVHVGSKTSLPHMVHLGIPICQCTCFVIKGIVSNEEV